MTRRQHAGRAIDSITSLLAQLACYLPNNRLRILVLRLLGASIGAGCAVYHGVEWRAIWRVDIGDDVFVAEHAMLDGRGGLTIGASTSINSGVQLWTAQHDIRSPDFAYAKAPIRIGHHAWVCSRAIVLPGTTIGDGAVVAAGAIVSRDVAPWTVVAGNPAVKIANRPTLDRYRLHAAAHKLWFM